MSEIVQAVLRMPPELFWTESPIIREQHDHRRFQAADEIDRLRAEVERLRAVQEPVCEVSSVDYTGHNPDGVSDIINVSLPMGTKLYLSSPDVSVSSKYGDPEALPKTAGWSGWACQYPGKMPRLYGAREIAQANYYPEDGDRLIFLTSKSQLDPGVSALVEALSALRGCITETRGPAAHSALVLADAALATYHKGEEV